MTTMEMMIKGGDKGAIRAQDNADIAEHILAVLKAEPNLRVYEIQARLSDNCKSQKITVILKRLVKAGAVKRIENPSEREFIELYDGFGKMVQIVRFALA